VATKLFEIEDEQQTRLFELADETNPVNIAVRGNSYTLNIERNLSFRNVNERNPNYARKQ